MLLFSFIAFNVFSMCVSVENFSLNPKLCRVWGPGLEPHIITMPARYFFIEGRNFENNSVTFEDDAFKVTLEGISRKQTPCRIWTNFLNRKDGVAIFRYKVYDPCYNLKINIQHNNEDVANSPYIIPDGVYPEACPCSRVDYDTFRKNWNCGKMPKQMKKDLELFPEINWDIMRQQVIKKFNQPHSISLCHYVIKNNDVYRTCYGKYVGFKMFMDSILLSLSRKILLPDVEFFVNLGDWPLVKKGSELFPIFSWCGSTNTYDIIMPTYDITESTLENMGRVTLDMLSVQGNVNGPWRTRKRQLFWRGRDSNEHRLNLITLAREHPQLFNASLTNFFFFRDKQDVYGPKSDHVSFFSFFEYKYQLNLDGTVAAYRAPYLLAGGSLVMKQDSQYYEHFYSDLLPNVHYLPIKRDLSNLIENINWAIAHDEQAYNIARTAQNFVNEHLLPQNIFCYYAQLLTEFSQRISSEIKIFDEMEKVESTKSTNCNCYTTFKDEL